QLADLAREQNTSLFRAVPFMTGKGGTNLARFAELIQQMAHEAQVLTLPELVEHVVHHSGLRAHYQNDREGVDRLENLQELVIAAAAFVAEGNFDSLPAGRIADDRDVSVGDGMEESSAMSPLAAFLTHASLEAGDNQGQAGQD